MSGFAPVSPYSGGRVALVACVGLLSAGAWLTLWLAGGWTHGFVHLDHAGHHSMAAASAMLLFVAGWTVMTVAMMLPTTVPILAVVHTFARGRPDRPLLLGLTVTGYLAVWALFGALVYLAGLGLRRLVALGPGLGAWLEAGGPALLLLAGAFQFSSLKYRCLDKCRSPLGFVIGRWRGRRYPWHSFRLGVDHGVFCVGCCWALMLLMFAVAAGSLGWMFLLAAVMAVEKNLPWGRRIGKPVGVALLAAGSALLAVRLG